MIFVRQMFANGLAAFSLAVALLVPSAARAADWTVAPAPTADEPFDAALAVSEAGDSLLVWSRPSADGIQVFAELHPADGVAFAEVMPVYRVDADEPVDTDVIRFKGEERQALWAWSASASPCGCSGSRPRRWRSRATRCIAGSAAASSWSASRSPTAARASCVSRSPARAPPSRRRPASRCSRRARRRDSR